MAAAAAAIPDPDFVIITGDYTRHITDEFGRSRAE
jgi:3',5'-cyclic AMP phosphodiesterase CpdA